MIGGGRVPLRPYFKVWVLVKAAKNELSVLEVVARRWCWHAVTPRWTSGTSRPLPTLILRCWHKHGCTHHRGFPKLSSKEGDIDEQQSGGIADDTGPAPWSP